MYRAKDRGRGRFELLDEEMRERAVARLRIEQDLRRAMAAGELLPAFQPIMRLDGGGTYGAEALLRWRHPTEGVLGPASFLAVAERSGLIVAIGVSLLQQSCVHAAGWNAGRPDPLCLKVNVSPRQLADSGFVAAVAGALASSGLRPGLLGLEVTEQALMGDEEHAAATLAELKALGVILLLDDFGTGYSSLSHLKRFPIDAVKIDRSFIEGLDQPDGEDAAIVHAVIGMGQATGKTVIAEGIETPQQCRHVQGLGCDLGQGYHFGRPMPADEFGGWLAGAGG
jgi:EAL domain-containing protein (putative c-di-GMP-specific phosphodiesterase class I)